MGVLVRSEIKPLKRVLLHRPGAELENLTPDTLERLLFDDIPWLAEAQREHDAFAEVLRNNGTEVLYLHKLMAEVIKDFEIKKQFLNQFIKEAGITDKETQDVMYDFFMRIEDEEKLVLKTMAGVNKKEVIMDRKGLTQLVGEEEEYPFIIDPMPNLYFTRDPFATIGDKISLNKMYSVTRSRETIFAEYIFKYHKDLCDTGKVYDRYFDFHIEGGDILNITDKVLAIGISQRTQTEAIERIAKEIFFNTDGNTIETILAFDIPKSRAYMHLDTVFTQVDYNKFTIHPGIQGPLTVYEITRGNVNGELHFEKVNAKLEDILGKHMHRDDIVLIPCGGGDSVAAYREQWNDGSNTLCIRPGEVVVYSRNDVTNKVLEEYGIKIHVIPSAELSRGRGGPRCMSMPLLREE